ncbi:MAG: transcription termination factor NusA [bacterium]|nr:transcription termination factor NusA [bacterium]
MKSEFELVFNEIAEQRALPRDIVLDALRIALVSAYRRDASIGQSQHIEAVIDVNNGRPRIIVEKEVVEDVQDSRTEVDLETARFYHPECNLGDMVLVQAEIPMKKFGRIAAQTAKQVILQKIREAERTTLYDEFATREGDLVTGTVQSVSPDRVMLSLGRAEAVLPRAQQIPGERYKPHDKVRAYIMEVKKTNRGPQIVVSRSHRNMLRRLLEYEVPEIYNGQVEIKAIAREAGYRSKVAVSAQQDNIDPVGACVGMRGIRIQNIVKELHEEKIDVIEWNPNNEMFIKQALSPARVAGVYLEDDPDTGRTAVVIVPDDQLSLAIGREGQNARLAAKLTGWRIDIKSVTEAISEALDQPNTPVMKEIRTQFPDMLTEVERIREKKQANRTVMPEEYQTLTRFTEFIQRRLLAQREAARAQRQAQIAAIRSTIPSAAFNMPIESLTISQPIKDSLSALESVGEIMLRYLIDENRLRQMLSDAPSDAMRQLQAALDAIVFPDEPPAPPETVIAAPDGTAIQALDGFTEEAHSADRFAPQPVGVRAPYVPDADFDDDEDDDGNKGGKKGKKGKKNRQLVFDEKSGGMVVKRQRKGNRGGSGWNEWEE